VNYFYGIPHYAVSIAVQARNVPEPGRGKNVAPTSVDESAWQTVAGVVLAPELDELFATETGQPSTLNGRPIRVSDRERLDEAIVSIGFFKSEETIRRGLHDFAFLIPRVRKMRLMGAAALDVVYVACGRFDAYIEYGVKLWDIAAGQLILENAGGRVESQPSQDGPQAFEVRMWNGKIPIDQVKLRQSV
jgi:myo-inositol-1(or 4)-monophosphatase